MKANRLDCVVIFFLAAGEREMKRKRKELKCKICGSSLVWSGKKRCQRCINLGLKYPIKIKNDSQKQL